MVLLILIVINIQICVKLFLQGDCKVNSYFVLGIAKKPNVLLEKKKKKYMTDHLLLFLCSILLGWVRLYMFALKLRDEKHVVLTYFNI